MITVAQIGQVFVKATQFLHPETVEITPWGIRHDRDFLLAEANDAFVNSEGHGQFFPLTFTLDAEADTLRLDMPCGGVVEGPAAGTGRTWAVNQFGLRMLQVAEVEGPWAQALSDFAGRPIRLVRSVRAGAGVDIMPITFVTTGSLRRLERAVGAPVDAARFRPGLVLRNEIEHEEDGWEDRRMRIGDAVLKVRSPVPRCGIPGFNPVGGERDQDIMKALIRYRDKAAYPDGMLAGYETPGFATYAQVIEPGAVRLGDPVTLLD